MGNSNAGGVIRVNAPGVVVSYNAFYNQTVPISVSNVNNSVVADFNYWGYNGRPTLSYVIISNYYVLGITNSSDLTTTIYGVGDVLSFVYTVFLNGTTDSAGANLLAGANNRAYWGSHLYSYFSLNKPGNIIVPVQTVAPNVINFYNLNGTLISSFNLTTISNKGQINGVSVDSVILVNNTTANIVLTIPNTEGEDGITLNVTINGQTQEIFFKNGVGTFLGYNYDNLGNQTINIQFGSNTDYNQSAVLSRNTTFKNLVNLNITADNPIYGENVTITINATTPNGTNILNGNYIITINGQNYTVLFTNGIGTVTIPGLNGGDYSYNVIFNTNEFYMQNNNNIQFTVNKQNTTINVVPPTNSTYGGNSTITGNLTDNNGNLINGIYNITITVNGVEYNVTVTNGILNLIVPNNQAGNKNILVDFLGNLNYNSSTASSSYIVNVDKRGSVMTVTGTRNGNTITYKITLKDSKGNLITDQNISLTIKPLNKVVVLKTNNQGIATYTIQISKDGQYTGTATFTGTTTTNINYTGTTTISNAITVQTKKSPAKIKITKKTTSSRLSKKYKIYYKTYYIKNYGQTTGSKTYTKKIKGTLKAVAKTSKIQYKYTKKTLKTIVKNLAYNKIAKIKLKIVVKRG
jgi:hypothetical protein